MIDIKKSLQTANILPDDWEEDDDAPITLPWFVKVMTALGAWFATFCFLAVYVLVSIDDIKAFRDGWVMVISGSIFMAAIYLINPIHEFSKHLRLSFSLVGQSLLFVGLYELLGNIYSVLLFIILIETFLLWIYREGTLKFISFWIIVGALVMLCETSHWVGGIHFIIAALAGSFVYLTNTESKWIASKNVKIFWVILYGSSTAMLIILLPSIPMVLFDLNLKLIETQWWISGLALAGAFYGFIWFLFKQWQVPLDSLFSIAVICVVAVISIAGLFAPGIIAGLLVLSVGFNYGDRFLKGLGIFYALVYMIAYYYDMQMTLLTKALILMAMGGIFLLIHFAINRYVMPAYENQNS